MAPINRYTITTWQRSQSLWRTSSPNLTTKFGRTATKSLGPKLFQKGFADVRDAFHAPLGNVSLEFDSKAASKTLPPGHPAQIRKLETFSLPESVTGSDSDRDLGKRLIEAWRRDGILQVAYPESIKPLLRNAFEESKAFFGGRANQKAKCVNPNSFAGYVASGEEITAGIKDYAEIFTVTKHLQDNDPRVRARWPCHGPNPWPSNGFATAISQLMSYKGEIGHTLLRLIGLGLSLKDPDALVRLTQDGWHHLRDLRFPAIGNTNGIGKEGRGIGSHTDYGLLVIASQDDVGGLFIRPPIGGEVYANWQGSSAGLHEDDAHWLYVAPVEDVFTVFPGDMMQLMTNSYLPSTLHKVGLNTRERFAFAYFHEPNFNAICKRLPEFRDGTESDNEEIHYGSHFTNMCMRNYPERITAQRMREENRMEVLPLMAKVCGFD